jgi:DNA-binding response OmpR family regulator
MHKLINDKAAAEPGSNTLMVVEPDVLARMCLADYLRDCGYKVIEGGLAQDVFDILEAGGTIDVILAEVNLPGGIDGFALASQIRKTHPGIDVILPLGIAKAADKAGELCEDGPKEKPFHPQEVVRRINMLRERRRTSKPS